MGIFTREEFESIIHDNKILDDTGATFVVVDKDLQILYVNYTANEKEGKFSPGDLLECSNAVSASNGCGTHESCKECKLREVVENSMNTNTKMEADANLLVKVIQTIAFMLCLLLSCTKVRSMPLFCLSTEPTSTENL